jgi:hypothetical protein
VLLVGLDPDIAKSPVPELTAAKVRAAVEADTAKLEALGYSVKSLYVDDGKILSNYSARPNLLHWFSGMWSTN